MNPTDPTRRSSRTEPSRPADQGGPHEAAPQRAAPQQAAPQSSGGAVPVRSEQDRAAFPKLSAAQIARVAAFGHRRRVVTGEILFEQGATGRALFVLLDGSIEAVHKSRDGETIVTVHEVGRVHRRGGYVARTAQPRGRPRPHCRARCWRVERTNVRRLMETIPNSARCSCARFCCGAPISSRTPLGDAVLIGSTHSADTLRIKGFLTRSGHPHTYLDVDRDPDCEALLAHFKIGVGDIPVMICCGRPALLNPSIEEVAAALGLNPEMDAAVVHDVIVVGAGPSGLAAAVYAASEGLDVLVLEAGAPGGQAGSSSRIENYLGFPTGVSGQELTDKRLHQAEKFGARIAVASGVAHLDCSRRPISVTLANGTLVQGRTVIVATGAAYRKLPLANIARFEGVGVYYGATRVEGQLCDGEEVAIVGAGNSAGQAAVFLSATAKHVHMLVRGDGLADSMSRYLIRRIEDSPVITLRTHMQVEALDGAQRLERVSWRNADTKATETHDIHHLFLMTGATPNTEWLGQCLQLDDKRFIKTGSDLSPEELAAAGWPLRRPPHLLETSVPGDLRRGRRAREQREARGLGGGRGLDRGAVRSYRAGGVRGRAGG